MLVLNSEQMRQADAAAIEKICHGATILMFGVDEIGGGVVEEFLCRHGRGFRIGTNICVRWKQECAFLRSFAQTICS